jgi:hypothetical protein
MKLLDIIKNFNNYLHFRVDQYRNYYPCKLIGESKLSSEECTYVKYKHFGYSNVFEQPIKELFENKSLLYHFHPEDVSKITLIAFGEVFFSKNEKSAKKQFEKIKNKIIDSMGDR